MPKFSKRSKDKLSTCDQRIQDILNEAIQDSDFSVICGHRSREDQNKAFASGNSHVQFPHSKHNTFPSVAVDVAPYPINWKDYGAFYILAGRILEIAKNKGIAIRYGGDWNGDGKTRDQSFHDIGHFELII